MAENDERTPRWVCVLGLTAVVVILLFVVLALVGGGHGPGRHAASEAGISLGAPRADAAHGVQAQR